MDVNGNTTRPRSVIRNGYSLVPCTEPRYLAIRNLRVASSSWIRWSSTMTQSETYSSMPYRVKPPARPRSPVITTVRSRSLSQRSSRFNSPLMMDSLPSAVNSTSMVSSTTRLAPTDSTAMASLMNRPSRSNTPVVTKRCGIDPECIDDEQSPPLQLGQIESHRRHIRRQFGRRFLEREQNPGLAEIPRAADQEFQSEQRLAGPGAAGHQCCPPARQTAECYLVETADAGRRLLQTNRVETGIVRNFRVGHIGHRQPPK